MICGRKGKKWIWLVTGIQEQGLTESLTSAACGFQGCPLAHSQQKTHIHIFIALAGNTGIPYVHLLLLGNVNIGQVASSEQ